jgi:hypothetical protein
MPRKSTQRADDKAQPKKAKPGDFATVARELGCDEDKERFERQLEKIAKAKVAAPIKGSRAR